MVFLNSIKSALLYFPNKYHTSWFVKSSVFFLVVANANMLAKISWSLIPAYDAALFVFDYKKYDNEENNMISYQNENRSAIPSADLFGMAKSERYEEIVLPVEKSRLNVIVTGIVYSDIPENNILIIERNRKQSSYTICDTISGTNAIIRKTDPQQIIVERAGNFELLSIEQTKNNADVLVWIANDIKSEKNKLPNQLLDYIVISPVNKSGHLQGYRIKPRKNLDFFNKSGMNANDLVVAINGYNLRDNTQETQFIAHISVQTQFALSVIRDNEEKEIIIDLNKL